MPHTSALPRSAAPSAAASGQAASGRRPYNDATIGKVTDLSDRLDRLMRDMNLGPVSHRQHEQNVEEAEAIAAGLRAAFRSPTSVRQEHPPLQQQGGKAWW